MRKLIAILAVALAIPTMSFADQVGRYQIASAASGGFFMLDTENGWVRYCFFDFSKKLTCRTWRDATKGDNPLIDAPDE